MQIFHQYTRISLMSPAGASWGSVRNYVQIVCVCVCVNLVATYFSRRLRNLNCSARHERKLFESEQCDAATIYLLNSFDIL